MSIASRLDQDTAYRSITKWREKKKTKKENKTNNHYHLHTVYDLLEEIPFHLGLYDSAN